MTSLLGPNDATWRHSSEPMEPPPPVTMTLWPSMERTHQPSIQLYSFAPQKIFYFYVADLLSEDLARREFPYSRDGPARHPRRATIGDGVTHLNSARRRHRNYNFMDGRIAFS